MIALSVALAIALAPYATGLLGIPVLYVALQPLYDWLARRAAAQIAANLVVVVLVVLLGFVGGSFVALIVSEAQRVPAMIAQSPIVARLSELKVGGVDVGTRLAELATKIVEWIGSSASGFIGTASRMALNLTISASASTTCSSGPGKRGTPSARTFHSPRATRRSCASGSATSPPRP